MAHASKKHIGAGATGKGHGSGAMTVRTEEVPDNMVLSNRDKAQHSASRGQDGKWNQVEQTFDSQGNQLSKDATEDTAAATDR